jgi:hypothetical protein
MNAIIRKKIMLEIPLLYFLNISKIEMSRPGDSGPHLNFFSKLLLVNVVIYGARIGQMRTRITRQIRQEHGSS